MWVHNAHGVYWVKVGVQFVAPSTETAPNTYASGTADTLQVAGLVERKVNFGHELPRTADPSITMVDRGIYHGYLITLPNTGGQWTNKFDRPVLIVEAAGATAQAARDSLDTAISLIQSTLSGLEDHVGVSKPDRIQIQPYPLQPRVVFLRGDQKRGLMSTLLLGIALTGAAVVWRRTKPAPVRSAIKEPVGV